MSPRSIWSRFKLWLARRAHEVGEKEIQRLRAKSAKLQAQLTPEQAKAVEEKMVEVRRRYGMEK